MAAPSLDPNLRSDAVTFQSTGYEPGARVWVHTAGAWRPGIVLHSSQHAATVRYRPAQGRGTSVDTVTGHSLQMRQDDDPFLDLGRSPVAPRGAIDPYDEVRGVA